MLIDELGVRSLVPDAWAEAYGKPQADPHSVFAELIGVTRQQAKVIGYEYMYSEDAKHVRAIELWHQNGKEMRFIYRKFANLLAEQGVLVPPLREVLEEVKSDE